MLFTTTTLLSLLVAFSEASPIASPIGDLSIQAPKGKKIIWMGHSFHMYLVSPVAQLAKEAGIQGHEAILQDMIPGSYPCQHWNKASQVKPTLTKGSADVLTVASRETAPDECIPKFVELGYKGNKNLKIMVQETWLPVSAVKGECSVSGKRPGESVNGGVTLCSSREITYEGNENTRKEWERPFQVLLRNQLIGLNQKYDNMTTLVNIWEGIISLREMVVKGQVPGVAKQGSLFADGLGHPQKPLRDFTSYMWYAALYNSSPVGSKVLAAGTTAGQAAVLQKLAWDTITKEPLSGLTQTGA